MQLRTIVIAFAAAVTMTATAQNGIDNPMTRAVLQVYEQQLQEHPDDYEIWMARANEYYTHSEYLRALNDVDNALKYIPLSKTQERCDALQLRANIYIQTERYDEAYTDLSNVVTLQPNNYVAIYQLANVEYSKGDYKAAAMDYKRLQRLNPRSAEALVGLARVAVKENNLGTANELLDQAVNLDPNNADYYVRRASVRSEMGMDREAVDDLVLALSTDSRNTRATQAIVNYANENYSAVIAGLTSAMQQAPKVGMFVYMRAVIAQAHFNYKAAIADFEKINKEHLYDYHGIYASMAQCYFALGKYDEALENIDQAISMVATNAGHYILRAQILRALGRNDEAFDQALKASVMNGGSNEALVEMGLCRASQEKWKEAADLFGEASMNDPNVPETLMLRAWVLEEHLNQPVAAKGFYEQVANMEGYTDENVRSLRGFGMLLAGQTALAKSWMENILTNVKDHDGFIHFMGACFYATAGDNDKALDCVSKALDLGFANYYDLTKNTDGRCTLAPLRDDLRFLNLLNRHSILF